ncbi:unnamed protein product [Clonostachys rosea f. rosea IK726]|uniref:Uncharacterized protein n=1 Tax=Clonostachys rosea f. rosea IK726 TaxID=1349383 RepID=A0ACA9TNV3_BIOOC|nr:unnamed protein product [Clonostachys rosea f. rosea IK726]
MAADTANKRILLISLGHKDFFDDMFEILLARLSTDAKFKRAKTSNSALRFLGNDPPPRAVIVTDPALIKQEQMLVRSHVFRYIRNGGTGIFMGHFASSVNPPDLQNFFNQIDLPWEAGSYRRLTHRLTHTLNPQVWEPSPDAVALPAQYTQKALFIKNVSPNHALYQTTPISPTEAQDVAPEILYDPNEAAVAVAPVGDGIAAYLGDLNGEPEMTTVTLALCGLPAGA